PRIGDHPACGSRCRRRGVRVPSARCPTSAARRPVRAALPPRDGPRRVRRPVPPLLLIHRPPYAALGGGGIRGFEPLFYSSDWLARFTRSPTTRRKNLD